MKRRNAESGKMRRPLKRTKITEGMYGNSLVYLKFVMLWATVVMADYMLEFRFEFLWPFWMMLRSVYDSFKYQGLAFSVFFICIALTSDMICYFFIPLQYIFFAASTYVWVQYTWYTFADKGLCLPTVAVCCLVLWIEGALRIERVGVGVGLGVGAGLCRPLAAHAVGYPAVTLGFGVKSYVSHRLRLRRQRRVRAENEFYFQLMRDALPEPAPDQQPVASPAPAKEAECEKMNGSVKRRCAKEQNGHCPTSQEHAQLQFKLDKLEKHLAAATAASARPHAQTNGAPPGPQTDDAQTNGKGCSKSTKCEKKEANTIKEEKKKNKNKDKDKESSDSNKSTEQLKEQTIVKEVESTKESVKNKECNGYKDKEKEREKEKEKDKEKEKEKEKDKERERESRESRETKESREARSLSEEVRRLRASVASALRGEAEARRALAACAAADRQRRADHQQLKQAHAALQHK
ncbi:macoilin-like [Ostrinia nubilalis]|uniref:macoilin-like n=1 Tax=Ostrinia nubilalis TaxID=29057 RepID=UPI003082239A